MLTHQLGTPNAKMRVQAKRKPRINCKQVMHDTCMLHRCIHIGYRDDTGCYAGILKAAQNKKSMALLGDMPGSHLASL